MVHGVQYNELSLHKKWRLARCMNYGVALFGGLGFGDDGHFSGIHYFMVVVGVVFTATMVAVGLSSTPPW